MIPNVMNKKMKIEAYREVNTVNAVYTVVTPHGAEKFWGVPAGYYGIGSDPFIEVTKFKVVVRTINLSFVSDITFEV